MQAHDAVLEVGKTRLLNRVSFELAPAEIAVVIGPNGAGKSSLVRLLSAEMTPSEGEVRLDGRPLGSIPRSHLARKMAVLSQHSTLDFPFRVSEVIEMGRIPHNTGRAANKRLVAQIIDRLQLNALQNRLYTSLSGGEKQRVQIARVLCQLWDCLEGGYLLFDEPTAPLDLAYQLSFLDIVHEVAARQVGVLLVMHDVNLALRFAHSVVLMKQGEIIATGSPGEVVTASNIRAAFDVEVEIIETANGAPVIYTRAPV